MLKINDAIVGFNDLPTKTRKTLLLLSTKENWDAITHRTYVLWLEIIKDYGLLNKEIEEEMFPFVFIDE